MRWSGGVGFGVRSSGRGRRFGTLFCTCIGWVVTVAIAHTHPNAASPQPSPKDVESPVPNYVISQRDLYVTDPQARTRRRVRGDWQAACR